MLYISLPAALFLTLLPRSSLELTFSFRFHVRVSTFFEGPIPVLLSCTFSIMRSSIPLLIPLLSTLLPTCLCTFARQRIGPIPEEETSNRRPICRGELPNALEEGYPFYNNQELCVESRDESATPSLSCRCNPQGLLVCSTTDRRHFQRRPPFFRNRRLFQPHCQRFCECSNGPDRSRSRRNGLLGTLVDSISNPELGHQTQGVTVDPFLGALSGGYSHSVSSGSGGGASFGSGSSGQAAVSGSQGALDDAGSSCISEPCSSFAQCSAWCGETVICASRALSAGVFFYLGECARAGSSIPLPGAELVRNPRGDPYGGRKRKRDTDGDEMTPLGLEENDNNGPMCFCNSTHAHPGCCRPSADGLLVWDDSWEMATLLRD